MKLFSLFILLIFSLLSCAGEEEPAFKSKKPLGGVYADYQVWAEEGADEVTIRLQYRQGNEEGDAFAVKNPGKVLLDGEELAPDSTRFMGVYYEATKSVDDFTGEHAVVFIDKSGREHREEFSFEPFSLKAELPENIRKKPFPIQLKNFPDSSTPIRLVMVDTSLYSAGVNEELMIEGGIVQITEEFLRHLTKGPVTMEIYREEEWLVRGGSTSSGKFSMTYGLRRHFNLTE